MTPERSPSKLPADPLPYCSVRWARACSTAGGRARLCSRALKRPSVGTDAVVAVAAGAGTDASGKSRARRRHCVRPGTAFDVATPVPAAVCGRTVEEPRSTRLVAPGGGCAFGTQHGLQWRHRGAFKGTACSTAPCRIRHVLCDTFCRGGAFGGCSWIAEIRPLNRDDVITIARTSPDEPKGRERGALITRPPCVGALQHSERGGASCRFSYPEPSFNAFAPESQLSGEHFVGCGGGGGGGPGGEGAATGGSSHPLEFTWVVRM